MRFVGVLGLTSVGRCLGACTAVAAHISSLRLATVVVLPSAFWVTLSLTASLLGLASAYSDRVTASRASATSE